MEWSKGKTTSQPVDLLVGVDVELALYGHLIVASGKEGVIHTLIATIDDSTATLPADYCFTVDLVGRSRMSPVVIPLKSCNADTQVSIPGLNTLDWRRYPSLVYDSPDDRRIVRTHVSAVPEAAHYRRFNVMIADLNDGLKYGAITLYVPECEGTEPLPTANLLNGMPVGGLGAKRDKPVFYWID